MDLSSTSFSRSTLTKSAKARKAKNRLAGGPSLLDSRLTTSSKIKSPVTTTGSVGVNAGNIQILVNGVDFTPLPLSVDEHVNAVEDPSEDLPLSNNDALGQGSPTNESTAKQQTNPNPNPNPAESGKSGSTALDHKESTATNTAETADKKGLNLEEEVVFTLSESCTRTVFHVPGICVEAGTLDHKRVSSVNEAYEALQKDKETSDMFTTKFTQTWNEEVKHKEVSATVNATVESACQANSWEIYDMHKRLEALDMRLEQDEYSNSGHGNTHASSPNQSDRLPSTRVLQNIVKARLKQVDVIVDAHAKNPGCLFPVEEEKSSAANKATSSEKLESAVASSAVESQGGVEHEEVAEILKVAERSIQQNVYHDKFRSYRGIPASAASEEQDTANPEIRLDPLWAFQCEETRGHGVSSISWNSVNKDLVAVSYCTFEFCAQLEDSAGLILLWTLKNPEYPERVIRCQCGVSSVDFSSVHPNLLGAGMYDGTIAIYDLALESNAPAVDSSQAIAQHKDAVWQVKWVDRGEKGEVLVSMSTDGRVMEWSLKKGISSKEIMLMKRISVPPHLGGGAEGLISRTASGMCFDFSLDDPHTYFAGTEDGTIHKCSSSYNEQYLSTYLGHTGPVYKVKCSPFNKNILLSCSADWSAKLWDVSQEVPLLTMQSVDMASVVTDVFWSPTHSTIFALCAEDGRIELWDLSRNSLDPVVTHFTDEKTCVEPTESLQNCNSKSPRKAAQSTETSRTEEETKAEPAAKSRKERRVRYSAISFAGDLPILVAGNGIGQVEVFRVCGLVDINKKMPTNVEEQRELFQKVLSREIK